MKFVNDLGNAFGKYEKYLGEVFSKDSKKNLKLKNFTAKFTNKNSSLRRNFETNGGHIKNIENTAGWENTDNSTRVFEKLDLKAKTHSRPDMIKAVITVTSGLDEGSKTKITDTRVNLGRRPSNELVLNDRSTSRLHAYIVPQEGTHVIYDAQSLNGTYVNGEPIISQKLSSGDEIKIGNTVILYTID